ncbi:efflux RND transporter periplasmic adaptor subunit [uncultured Hymenobacter sp.]|uniref:efflux RND transporter periplasmic adaptor subunit n=1 Tax=uncultured Hymenobacter sp. TaxID=170016 RepID=UPI0035CA9156
MGLIFLSFFASSILFGAALRYPLRAQYQHQNASIALSTAFGPAKSHRSNNGLVTTKGTVEAIRTLPLMAPGHGWVREVFFADGDYVRGRQILLKFLESDSRSGKFSRNYLLAPRSGFLVKRNVEVGYRLRPSTCVATLQDVSQVQVPLAVSPQVGRSVRVCDPVLVRVAEMPGRTFTGVVERIEKQKLPRPKTVVLITVRNAVAPLIRPLMHAHVSWNTRQLPSSVAQR